GNWAFLNYTTAGGYALTGSRSSAIVAIPELQDMIFVALVPLVIVGLKWRAQRREKEEGVADSGPWIGGPEKGTVRRPPQGWTATLSGAPARGTLERGHATPG